MIASPDLQATGHATAAAPPAARRVRPLPVRALPVCPLLVGAVVAFLPPTAAKAQSFDCGQARDVVERAIRGSSRLRQLDTDLARAYAAALGRDAARADSVRQAQRSWTKLRAACVTGARTPAAASVDPERCLADAYTDRLAALTPSASSAIPPARVPPPASVAATPTGPVAAPSIPAARAPASVAAGRGLAALKLWRDCRDLVALPEAVRIIAHGTTDETAARQRHRTGKLRQQQQSGY